MFRDETTSPAKPVAWPLTRGGALDGLRFLAAFCMVIHHYSVEAPVPLFKIHPVFERGYLATDFFIIVSGYVMARIYGARVADGRVGMGTFFLRRAGRVVPAHLMMAAAFVVIVLLATAAGIHPLHPEWFVWRELPGQVLLVQALGPFGGKGWNAPAWSLSALLVCYLAFPTLWRALKRIRRPATALIIGAGGLALADVLTQRFLGYPVYQMPMNYGAIRALPLFLLGTTLAICAESLVIPPVAAMALGVGSLAAIVAVQVSGSHSFVTLSLISAMVLAAGAIPVRKPSKVLEKAALVSFALFITNEFVRVIYFGVDHQLITRLHLNTQWQWAIFFGGPCAAVAFAVAFHYLVDWPSQGVIKPWVAAAPRRAKRWLTGMLPTPDPAFEPLTGYGRAPRVREIVLQIGPVPGAVYRRGLETPAGPSWG